MKKVDIRDGRKGFTIVELLFVVAIIIILTAVGFIAGMRLIRNMRQSHLDKRAEAVYYAAESRMMELFVTEEKTEETEGTKVKSVVEKLYNANTFDYEGGTLAYITSEDVGEAKQLFTNDNSLEAELKSASWIIEYDPVSLNVYAVILSDDLEKAGTSIGALTASSSGAPVRGTPQDRIAAFDGYVGYYSEGANDALGASAKSGLSAGVWILNRRDLLGVIKITVDENTKKAIKNLSFKVTLKGVKSTTGDEEGVDISSNEIYWQNYEGDKGNNYLENGGKTGIIITTNDVRNSIPVSCFGDTKDNERYGLIGYIKLDSLDIDRQFKDLKTKNGGSLGSYITPGDDITMSVKVWDSGDGNAAYSQNVRSTSAVSNTENSMFADFDIKNGNGVAEIVYPRHLQNLASDFSKVEAKMAAGDGSPGAIDAILLEDITWDEEKNLYKPGDAEGVVRNFTPISNNQLVSFNGYRFDEAKNAQPLTNIEDALKENPEEVNFKTAKNENKYHVITGIRIDTSDTSYKLVGNPTDIGLFGKQSNLMLANLVLYNFQIKNNNAGGTGMLAGELTNSKIKNLLVYTKKDEKIADQVITGAGDTGAVMGSMSGTTIEDCVIKDISVKTTAGSAGALAGKAVNCTVLNTLAYNGELGSTDVAGNSVPVTTVGYDDAKLEITGGKNAGGFIGEMDGGSIIGSAAALYVRATNGSAGGFVGSANGTSFDMCHAGGHTVVEEGKTGRYSKEQTENTKGRVNVIGNVNAGGFAGKLDGASVSNSYSTCSAAAGTVGGFAGASSGGTIANSYGVGKVFFTNEAAAGGFVGSLGGTGLSDDHYFEIINPTESGDYLKGVGGSKKDEQGLKAIDALLGKNDEDYEYNKFMLPADKLTLERGEKTHRYNENLNYDNYVLAAIYGMPFCADLKGADNTELFFAGAHYGDWPVVENLVVNSESSAKFRLSNSDPFAIIKAFASDLGKSDVLRSLAEDVITTPIPEEDLNENKETSEEVTAPSDNEGSEASENEAAEDNSSFGEESGQVTDSSSSEVSEQNTESENSEEEQKAEDETAENAETPLDTPETEEVKDENAENKQEVPEEAAPSDETEEKETIEGIRTEEIAGVKIEETDCGEEIEESEEDAFEGFLEAEDKGVIVRFGKDAEIPEGSELLVSEITEDSEDFDYSELVSDATNAMEIDPEEVASYRALDIAIVYDGEEIQPKAAVDVEIKADALYENNELFLDDVITAVNMRDDEAEVIGTELKKDGDKDSEESIQIVEENPLTNVSADSFVFTTDGFSAYVFVQPISVKSVVASDNNTYQISVEYDNASGIPADAELIVSEIGSDSDEFISYVENGCQTVQTGSENVKDVRIFDISFVNPETGEHYQPIKDVKVSVQTAGSGSNDENNEIKVVHFADETELVDSAVNGGVIEFNTSSFSVYTILNVEVDAFDASLGNKKFYISHYDGGVNHYLSYLGTDIIDETNKGNAKMWTFTSNGNGYKIHDGLNYIGKDGANFVITGESAAIVFVAGDMGDAHWICESGAADAAFKYIGYSAGFSAIKTYAPLGGANDLVLTYAGDVEDASMNGGNYYIRDNSGNYLTISGSSLEATTNADEAAKWSFEFVRNGYKIRTGVNYIGVNQDQWVVTDNENAVAFISSDMGDYHYLKDTDGNYIGYNDTDGYSKRYPAISGVENELIISTEATGADFVDKSCDDCDYFISVNGNFLYLNGGNLDDTQDASLVQPWKFSYDETKGGYVIHQGTNYIVLGGTALTAGDYDAASAFIVSDMGDYHAISDVTSHQKFMQFASDEFNMAGTDFEAAGSHVMLSTEAADMLDKSLDGHSYYIIGGNGWFFSNSGEKFRSSTPKSGNIITKWTFTATNGGYKLHNGTKYVKMKDNKKFEVGTEDNAAVFVVSDMGGYHLLRAVGGAYLGFGAFGTPRQGYFEATFDPTDFEAKLIVIDDISIDSDYIVCTKDKDNDKYYALMKDDAANTSRRKSMNITGTVDIANNVVDDSSLTDKPTIWTFEKAEEGGFLYYVKTPDGKYLNLASNAATLSDTPVGLYVVPRLDTGTNTNRNYRLVTTFGTNALGGFNDSYRMDGSNDNANMWHYLASVKKQRTVHYIYNQDPDDVGTAENLPPTETIVVSEDSIKLRQPKITMYISTGKGFSHAYFFKGWRISGTTKVYAPGTTVPLSEDVTNFEAVWEYDQRTVIVKYIINDVESNYGRILNDAGETQSVLPMYAIDNNGSKLESNAETVIGNDTFSYGVRDIRNLSETDSRLYHLYQRLSGNDYHTYEFKYWKTESGEILKPGDKINLADYKNQANEVKLTAYFVNAFKNGTPAYVSFSIIKVADTPDNTFTNNNELIGISESLSDYCAHVGGTIMNGVDDQGNIIYPDDIISPTNPNVKYWMIAPYSDREEGSEKEVLRTDNAVRYKLYGDGYTDDGYVENKFHQNITGMPSDVKGPNNYGPVTSDLKNTEIHKWQIPYLPSDEKALKRLRDTNAQIKYKSTDESTIPISELTPENFTLRWYFVKYQAGDKIGFHIDGKLTRKTKYIAITKTFKEKKDCNAIEGIFDKAKKCYESTDTIADIGRKLIKKENECFYIELEDTKNKDHTIKLVLYDRVKKDDEGNDVATSYYSQMGTGTDTYGYLRNRNWEDSEYKYFKFTWLVTFDEYNAENEYILREKNYNFEDEKERYGVKIEYNRTKTGTASDEEVKEITTETIKLKPDKIAEDRVIILKEGDTYECIKTNLYNTYYPGSMLLLKKVDGNVKKTDGTEEVLKDIEFRIYEGDKTDPEKVYKISDGKYSLFVEEKDTVGDEKMLTNEDGLLDICLKPSEKTDEPRVYTIRETIPKDHTGFGDAEYNGFKITIDHEGKITLKKDDILFKKSYGSVIPCDNPKKNDGKWVKINFDDNDMVQTGFLKVVNGGIEDVAFCKIDGDNKMLAGAVFQLYEALDKDDKDTFDEVIKENTTAKIADVYTADSNDPKESVESTGEAIEKEIENGKKIKGNVNFKVSPGVYYMKEITVPNEYEPDYYIDPDIPEGEDPDKKDDSGKYVYHKPFIYKVTVGNDEVKKIKTPDLSDSEKTFIIQRCYKEGGEVKVDQTLNVEKFGIINISTIKKKVLLKKIDGSSLPFAGKEFEILRADRTVVIRNLADLTNSQAGEGKLGTMHKVKSGAGGAFFIDRLGVGTYYIHEISPDKWFKLEITKDKEPVLSGESSKPEIFED